MMNSPIVNFPSAPIIPLVGKWALELAINLNPNTVFAKGTVLGNITSAAADVQTITLGGSATGGTFTLSGFNPLTGTAFTVNPAYNAATSAVQALLVATTAFGAGNVTVTGSAGSSYVITFAGNLLNVPIQLMTGSATGMTGGSPTFAIAHSTIGRSAGTYNTYASGNSDGTQTPTCILKFDCATDAFGNITYGTVAGGGEWGQTTMSTPAYFSGYFLTANLTGLDSNAVSKLGKLIQGTTSAGILDIN